MPHMTDTTRLTRIKLVLDEYAKHLRILSYRAQHEALSESFADWSMDKAEFVLIGGDTNVSQNHSLYPQLVYARRDCDAYFRRRHWRPPKSIVDDSNSKFFFRKRCTYMEPYDGLDSDDEELDDTYGFLDGRQYDINRIYLALSILRLRFAKISNSQVSHSEYLAKFDIGKLLAPVVLNNPSAIGISPVSDQPCKLQFLKLVVYARSAMMRFCKVKRHCESQFPNISELKEAVNLCTNSIIECCSDDDTLPEPDDETYPVDERRKVYEGWENVDDMV